MRELIRSFTGFLYAKKWKRIDFTPKVYLHRKNYKREDDNIFFTGLIVWTLRQQRSKLSPENQITIDTICKRAIVNYPNYQNKKGDCTYNFWEPKPNRHFPNDRFLSNRKNHALPDDLDDTSVLYLSNPQSDSLNKRLHQKMANYSNGQFETIQNTFRKYKHSKAYNTWFAKKMNVDFDICVQANALRWVLENKLELNQYDSVTIQLIKQMVLADEIVKFPHYVSPHYQKTSIILYHLARLIAIRPELFQNIRQKVLAETKRQLFICQHSMEILLLKNSLARLGEKVDFGSDLNEKDFSGFYFFVANMTSVAPNPFKRWFALSKWTNMYYQSKGYYWALLFEYECLKSSN